MNAKISLFFICVEAIIYSYYIICMTVPLSKMWEISKLQLFEISSQEIFTIFLIGYNWSHSVHFYFAFQLL